MPRSAPEEEEDEGEQRMKAGRGVFGIWRQASAWLCVSKTRSSHPLRCPSGQPECIAQTLGNLSLLPFKWPRPGSSNCLLTRLWEESLGERTTAEPDGSAAREAVSSESLSEKWSSQWGAKGVPGAEFCPHLFFPRDTWKAHSEVTGAGQKCGVKAFIRETVWAGLFRPFVAQSGSCVWLRPHGR